jgi:hypothetical protein
MLALVFEAYGAFCFFSLVAFLVWAAAAKVRPDLDEDIDELEKLKRLASSEQSGDALSVESSIGEDASWSAPAARPIKRSKRMTRRRPHLIHTRKARTT